MKFFEKKDNVERTYIVNYDENQLRKLLNLIVRKTSYRTSGKFTFRDNGQWFFKYDDVSVITKIELPNGDPVFEDVAAVYKYTSDDYNSYHDDSIAIEGTRVISPELAYIIQDILSGDTESIRLLFDYEKHEDLVSIEEKIAIINKMVNETNNFDTDKKEKQLRNLDNLYCEKNLKQYFDTELLKYYYSQTCALINLQLISEKTVLPDQKSIPISKLLKRTNNKQS